VVIRIRYVPIYHQRQNWSTGNFFSYNGLQKLMFRTPSIDAANASAKTVEKQCGSLLTIIS
jgi:hypothetical protein